MIKKNWIFTPFTITELNLQKKKTILAKINNDFYKFLRNGLLRNKQNSLNT